VLKKRDSVRDVGARSFAVTVSSSARRFYQLRRNH
jgi:hypothetical protein